MLGLKFRFALISTGVIAVYLCSGQSGAPLSYIYTEAPRFDPSASLTGTERFPAGAKLQFVSGGARRALVAGFAASADASISFDGKRALFSGKQKPGDPWQIWETALAGGTPRRITSTAEDCIRPFYLPEDKIVYSRRLPDGFQLEILSPGAPALRLTYAPGNWIATDVLRDGRILMEGPHGAGRDIYAIYSDGSGIETHRCDHTRDRHSARELSNGDIVFTTGTRLARFTSARAGEIQMTLPAGEFAGPVEEIAPGELLVSYRAAASAPFALCRWTPGRAPAPLGYRNAYEPVVVRDRAVPPRHPSSLGDRDGTNLLCLNAYVSKGARIAAGSAASVHVYSRTDAGAPVLLGRAPVEKDGSFYVNVPSERPIRIELVDASARPVYAEKGWFWTRRGEQRVCVGCHVGPERAPENATPQVLVRTQTPVKMALPPSGASGATK